MTTQDIVVKDNNNNNIKEVVMLNIDILANPSQCEHCKFCPKSQLEGDLFDYESMSRCGKYNEIALDDVKRDLAAIHKDSPFNNSSMNSEIGDNTPIAEQAPRYTCGSYTYKYKRTMGTSLLWQLFYNLKGDGNPELIYESLSQGIGFPYAFPLYVKNNMIWRSKTDTVWTEDMKREFCSIITFVLDHDNWLDDLKTSMKLFKPVPGSIMWYMAYRWGIKHEEPKELTIVEQTNQYLPEDMHDIDYGKLDETKVDMEDMRDFCKTDWNNAELTTYTQSAGLHTAWKNAGLITQDEIDNLRDHFNNN